MTIRILLFAAVREAAASDCAAVELPDGASYLDLKKKLATQLPAAASLIEVSRIAADGAFVEETSPVSDTDEIAIIPPVSGG